MKSSDLKIVLLEPFFTGSHQQWAEGLRQNSRHDIEILSLKGRHWKWRMYGGAVALADQFNKLNYRPDLLLATDMLDLSTFLALTRNKSTGIPTAIYFHENQMTYPWSPDDEDVELGRNNQYGFINYTSTLAADHVFFNSLFHKNAFLNALPNFLGQFPDNKGLDNIGKIKAKSQVLPLGMDLKRFDTYKNTAQKEAPVLLWNHRWEYDKNPDAFFDALFSLKNKGIKFQLAVLGESYKSSPPIFAKAKKELDEQIIHFGYADSFEEYASLLWTADILPVTSRQDFFGGSVVEAIYCGCAPLLPKRLAFPEHLPEKLHSEYYYEKEEDFFEKLKDKILNIDNQKSMDGNLFVGKYDWTELVKIYDTLLSGIVLK